MKKILFSSMLLIFSFEIQAQKNYSTSKAEVHFIAEKDQDIESINKEVTASLKSNGQVLFSMLMNDFHFEMDKMQEHFNSEYAESDKFPKAYFSGQITNFQLVNFKKDGKYPITINGKMQVHGVSKAIQSNGIIEIKGTLVKASTQFVVRLKDFEMGGLLIDMVADKVKVEVSANF